MHRQLALADAKLGICEDTGVQQHYEEMWDRINGINLLGDATSEYYEIGYTTFFGAFNTEDYMWDQWAILNPDYVKVESTWINQKPLIKLVPDEALKRVVQTHSPEFIYNQLPDDIIRYVMYNQEIPLDPNNTLMLNHARRPYEAKGRSIIKRILKTLMLEDRFNQANFAIATRNSVPITVVKVGDPNSVEEDHFITYKQNGKIFVQTFKEFWNNFSGTIWNKEDKQIKDLISHDLYTQSLDQNGIYSWNKIQYILRHKTPEKIMEVSTPFSKTRSTESHGYVWINPSTTNVEKVTPLQLRERSHPSIITIDKFDYSINSKTIFGLPLTEDLSYLIGLWSADGYFSHTNKSIWISNKNVNGIGRYLLNLPKKVNFVENVKRHGNPKREYRLRTPVLTYHLLNLYENLDNSKSRAKTGKEKVIPEILFNKDSSVVGAFFAGVIDGDGSIPKKNNTIMISCGKSKLYHHWLSLGLLAKGIKSNIRFVANAWELKVNGKDNVIKLLDLIQVYLKHSKKIKLASALRDRLNSQDRRFIQSEYVYDFDDPVLEEIFDGVHIDYPSGQTKLAVKELMRHNKRISKFYLDLANDGKPKQIAKSVCSVAVNRVTEIDKSSEYVYDLMLENNPHTYLTAGEGWQLVHNTGYLPQPEEIDAVRELFSTFELDPNFTVFYHYGINVEFYGANGKTFPILPELEFMMRLKFLGLDINEQLLTGAGGTYAQAYVSLEVQRQRYLNLQLKLEQLFHNGIFKPIAEVCGFYTVNNSIIGYKGASKKRFGSPNTKNRDELKRAFSSIRDTRDNKEFREFLQHKYSENVKQIKEYIFPKLDWGSLSASTDEAYKSYILKLKNIAPYLVDDSLLAKMGRIDRDQAEKAYLADLRRAKERMSTISKEGLGPFMKSNATVGGPMDLGGGGPDLGGIGLESPAATGGEPNAPTGKNGAPANAEGGSPVTSSLRNEILGQVSSDDDFIKAENDVLLKNLRNVKTDPLISIIEGQRFE